MMTSKTTKSPWHEIADSRKHHEYISLQVSDDINPKRKKIFWAKNVSGAPCLIVEYDSCTEESDSLPALKYIKVIDYPKERCIILVLRNREMIDVFEHMCIDIIQTIQRSNEDETRSVCILRLERWSRFLQPDRNRLSLEEQKGLIAELNFLRKVILPRISEVDALKGWTGPSKAPRDFSYGQLFVEIKSKRGSASPSIAISSEYQLEFNPSEILFVNVNEINPSIKDDLASFSLDDVVNEVKKLIKSELQLDILDAKLAQVGYFAEDNYSEYTWTQGQNEYFLVSEGFPRIVPAMFPHGVGNVKYTIDLAYCSEYKSNEETIVRAIEKYANH